MKHQTPLFGFAPHVRRSEEHSIMVRNTYSSRDTPDSSRHSKCVRRRSPTIFHGWMPAFWASMAMSVRCPWLGPGGS